MGDEGGKSWLEEGGRDGPWRGVSCQEQFPPPGHLAPSLGMIGFLWHTPQLTGL